MCPWPPCEALCEGLGCTELRRSSPPCWSPHSASCTLGWSHDCLWSEMGGESDGGLPAHRPPAPLCTDIWAPRAAGRHCSVAWCETPAPVGWSMSRADWVMGLGQQMQNHRLWRLCHCNVRNGSLTEESKEGRCPTHAPLHGDLRGICSWPAVTSFYLNRLAQQGGRPQRDGLID